jgi:hypothetical protein
MKVAGMFVLADGKFQPSGISENWPSPVTFPRLGLRLELSVCYHTPTSTFARLSSHYRTITISHIHCRRLWRHFIAHQVSVLRSISE